MRRSRDPSLIQRHDPTDAEGTRLPSKPKCRPGHAGRPGDREGARHPAALARRLPDARCQGRRALRRQGAGAEEARRSLHPDRPPAGAAAPHGARDAQPGDHHHRQRGRGAAAGGQPHQAAAAALQHRPPRRQILSLAGADRGPPLPADRQAPGRAAQGRELLGALRLRLGGEPDPDGAAAGLPAALLPRHGVRQPRPALPAAPDPPLLGALRRSASARTDYAELVRQAKQFLSGETPSIQKDLAREMEDGRRAAGIRARRRAARPHPRPDPCAGARPHQHGGRAATPMWWRCTSSPGSPACRSSSSAAAATTATVPSS